MTRCPGSPASVMQMVHCPLVPGPARGWSIYRSLARLLTTSHCRHRYRASVAQGLRGNYKFIFAEYLNFVSDYSRFEITPTGANRQEAACKCVGKHFIHSISKEVLSQEVKEEKKENTENKPSVGTRIPDSLCHAMLQRKNICSG